MPVNFTGSLAISGSLLLTGSITTTGGITISGSIASASFASNADLLDNLDSTSFVFTSSFNSYSSSISTRVTNTESTGSSLTTASGSFSTRVTNLESTGSSLTTASGSFSTRTTNLESTGSSLTTASSSFSTRVTNTESTGSSLTTASGSFSTRISSIEGNYATTGSNVFMGAQTVCANITSTGTIVAQTINVQQVTSSIVYSSGSNIFGNLSSDIQQMTGSLRITGSLNTIGNACVTSICSPTFIGGTISGTTAYASTVVCSPSVLSSGTICSTGNTCFGGMSVVANCLGIGTATPTTILHVSQPSANTVFRLGNNTTYDQFIYFNGNNDWSLGMDYSNSNAFVLSNSSTLGTNDRMVITTSGGVGIGTTTPNALLHISSVDFDDTYVKIEQRRGGYASSLNLIGANDDGAKYNRIMSQTCGGTNHWQIGGGGVASTMVFLTGNVERMRITSTGIACFACQVCAPAGIYVGTTSNNTILSSSRIHLNTCVQRLYTINHWELSNGSGNQCIVVDGAATYGCAKVANINASSTFFFGPYSYLTPGSYVAKFRMKVDNNSSNATLFYLDTNRGGGSNISANTFCTSGCYQYINIPFTISSPSDVFEARALNYTSGITCAYLDHVLIEAAENPGQYFSKDNFRLYTGHFNCSRLSIDTNGNTIFNCNGTYCSNYAYNFLGSCNGSILSGPHTMGNMGAGTQCATPLWCSSGALRMEFNWSSGGYINWVNHNNCTPFLLQWSADNYVNKFCFDYNGRFCACNTISAPAAIITGCVGLNCTSPGQLLTVNGVSSFKCHQQHPSGQWYKIPFYIEKNTGTVATTKCLVVIDNNDAFQELHFTIEYGSRLQGVSDSVTQTSLRTYGVNRFNSGTIAVHDTYLITGGSGCSINTHAPMTVAVVGTCMTVVKVDFSSSATHSSFVWGEVRIWSVESLAGKITISNNNY